MKKIIMLTLLLVCSAASFAGPVTRDQAKKKAQAFLTGDINGKRRAPARLRSTNLRQVMENDNYHVFNVGQNDGFVIVSGSDQTQPILGYADSGAFDPNHIPDALRLWLSDLETAVQGVDKGIPQKRNILFGRKLAKRTTKHAVPVLMASRWNQGDPYNLQTPSYIEDVQNEDGTTTQVRHDHSATGCVATAMAQVMYYWKWPQNACATIPKYSSDWNQWRTLGPLSPTTFKWDDMTDTYDSGSSQKAKDAVAELMKYVGYSIQMGYGPSSGAASVNCGTALRNYYGYAQTTQFVIHDNYTYPEWEDLIYGELALGRPVLMAGDNYERTGGHQWVCDGYDGNGLFHMNWGWGGMSDGFFLLTVMKPGAQGIGGSTASDGYSMGHNIYIGLEPPGRTPEPIDEPTVENLFTITALTAEKSEYTRRATTGIFAPKFNIRLKNETSTSQVFDLGISLYDEDGNVVMNGKNEIFSNFSSLEIGAGQTLSKDIGVSLRNVPNGTYKMRARCKIHGETEWKDAIDSESIYGILIVNDLTLNVETVPKSGINLQVNAFELVGKTTFNQQQRVRVNFTNNGGDYYSDTYLYVDNKRVSGNTIYIPAGATMDIYFTYTPTSGSHTFILTRSTNISDTGAQLFKTTFNVTENTVPTLAVTQALTNKVASGNILYTNEMRIKVILRNRTEEDFNGNVKSSLWHYGWSPSLREQTITVSIPAKKDTTVYFTYDNLEWNYDYNYHTEVDGRSELVSNKYTTKDGGIIYWLSDGTKEGVAKTSSFAVTPDMAAVYLPINSGTTPVSMTFTTGAEYNPNLIVYYDGRAVVPTRVMNGYVNRGLTNFVYGEEAENITVTDGHPFIAGRDFTAKNISYTRANGNAVPTEGTSTATTTWETLVLPFAPQRVTDADGNELNWKKGDDTQLFIKDFTAINGTKLYFEGIKEMTANRPYIYALDGNAAKTQSLTFSAENASVEQSDLLSTYGNFYKYLGTYSPVNAGNIYLLNAAGDKFAASAEAADVAPFRGYFVANTPEAATEKALTIVLDSKPVPTGIESLTSSPKGEGSRYVYDLQGRKIANSTMLTPGIYIVNGKKIVIR